ncbi:MAG: hypothetical protein KDK60_02710, partial [Chlamydiia bacterium]|nr:hypothetical protein [Chlamydiia bacterium]
MKNIILIGLLFLFLVGCTTNSALMTRDKYAEVSVGMSAEDLEKQFGRPYKIVSKGEGTETYEYVEKI